MSGNTFPRHGEVPPIGHKFRSALPNRIYCCQSFKVLLYKYKTVVGCGHVSFLFFLRLKSRLAVAPPRGPRTWLPATDSRNHTTPPLLSKQGTRWRTEEHSKQAAASPSARRDRQLSSSSRRTSSGTTQLLHLRQSLPVSSATMRHCR